MKLKKAILLTSAIAALAAPTAAQATEYHGFYDHEGNTITEPTTVEGQAKLTNILNGIFLTGPVLVDLHGFVDNEEGMGVGVLDEVHFTAPETGIPTNVPGCFATSATTSTLNGTEGREEVYPLTVETPDVLPISNVTVTWHYSEFCQKSFGIPSTLSVTGGMTGTIISPECVEFNTLKDDLFTENALGQHQTAMPNYDFRGEACFEGATFG